MKKHEQQFFIGCGLIIVGFFTLGIGIGFLLIPWGGMVILSARKNAKKYVDVEQFREKLRLSSDELASAHREAHLLLSCPRYLNHRAIQDWRNRYETLSHFFSTPVALVEQALQGESLVEFSFCRDLFSSSGSIVQDRNERWVQDELSSMKRWFDKAEAHPLTGRQREAIVKDEDNCLVIAGAGTGKTSTVVAKVGYLLHREHATREQILVLAFARKARGELEERLRDRFGVKLEVRTFHSLGLSILGEADGRKPDLAKVAEDQVALVGLMEECLDQVLEDRQLSETVINFFAYYLRPSKSEFTCSTQGEYLEYLKSYDVRTLRNEPVKSHEEMLIANWLFCNGVEYQYEARYQEAETATPQHSRYQPDFRLTESGIYIEHFGINRDGRTAPYVDQAKYHRDMEWKRNLHRENETTLVETFSYEHAEGNLLKDLETKLRTLGVKLRPMDDREFWRTVQDRGEVKQFSILMRTFLNLFKSHPVTLAALKNGAEDIGDGGRTKCFLEVFEAVYGRYEMHLARERAIDFHDMIARATNRVKDGSYRSPFKCIIVDEFQDISPGRAALVKALLEQVENPRLFCVGDDWQSIFRFTGSNIELMTKFERHFGKAELTHLDRTFRFNDCILRASTQFITANPNQLKKELVAHTRVSKPSVLIRLARVRKSVDEPLAEALNEIQQERKRASVMLLGRYNFTFQDLPQELLKKHSDLRITCQTVHKAKGLESDYVIVLDVSNGKYGFPSRIADDPLLNMLLAGAGGYENAEERRLFYVALTRARHKVFLLADEANRSCFLAELSESSYSGMVSVQDGEFADSTCRICESLLVNRSGPHGPFWGCTNYPRCPGKGTPCPRCRRGVLVIATGAGKCNLRTCGHMVRICPRPRCNGFLVPRTGPYGPFLGCSTYPDCHQTRRGS